MHIYQEAVARGCEHAGKIVVLTDGVGYNKTIASTHFPGAAHIIDLYHAREHLADLAKALGFDDAQQRAWRDLLDMGRVEDILEQANSRIVGLWHASHQADELRKGLDYFKENANLMRYAEFRLAGYFVGSVSSRGMQHGHRPAPQALGHVLEPSWRQCHYRFSLLSALRAF